MIYDYHCKNCNNEVEVEHKITEEPKVLCDHCQFLMERIISKTHFVLKGDKWFNKKGY